MPPPWQVESPRDRNSLGLGRTRADRLGRLGRCRRWRRRAPFGLRLRSDNRQPSDRAIPFTGTKPPRYPALSVFRAFFDPRTHATRPETARLEAALTEQALSGIRLRFAFAIGGHVEFEGHRQTTAHRAPVVTANRTISDCQGDGEPRRKKRQKVHVGNEVLPSIRAGPRWCLVGSGGPVVNIALRRCWRRRVLRRPLGLLCEDHGPMLRWHESVCTSPAWLGATRPATVRG